MLNVKLLSHTPDPENLVSTAAKLCYSSSSIDDLAIKVDNSDNTEFINMLRDIGHDSVFEHITFTFGIEGVSRILTHQLVRTRIASHCLSGDTIVYTDMMNRSVKKRTLKELYNMKKGYRDTTHLRSIDENNLFLINNKIQDIVFSGKKETYEVKTENGYNIRATLDHKFFTEEGWKKLKNIKEGDKVYVNGKPLYQKKEWLKEIYQDKNLSQIQIAEICNVSKHTIRKWVSSFGLQKETGEWSKGVEPPNKGKTKENYEPMLRTSQKMMGNTNYTKLTGPDHHSYKDNITVSGGYSRTKRDYNRKYICELCNKTQDKTEVHHKDLNPTNDTSNNLEELCITCHKLKHKGAVIKTVILDKIISIDNKKEEDTYDVSMYAPYHNFIANGFVVHNSQQSQRYVKLDQFEYVIPNRIKNDPIALARYNMHMESCQVEYDWHVDNLISQGFTEKEAIEDARYIIPSGAETKIICTINARSLFNLFSNRLCNRAQREYVELAEAMLVLVNEVAPTVFKSTGKPCSQLGYCPEGKMQCKELEGKVPTK